MDTLIALRNKLAEQDLDAFYIRNLTNIKWATGFKQVFDDEPAHALIVTDLNAWLHSDGRYINSLNRASADTEIEVDDSRQHHFSYALAQLAQEYDFEEFAGDNEGTELDADADLDVSGDANASVSDGSDVSALDEEESFILRIGIETSISLAEYRHLETLVKDSSFDIELVECSGFVEELRQVKNAAEVEAMKKAQSITDAAFAYICSFMKEGMTEKEVQLELDRYMLDAGADGLAFGTIVATGANGASPHATPGDTKLKAGDCVVMDFGAKYAGYCSDMTRCVFVGEPSQELKDAWNLLRKVNETCEGAIKEGVPAADVHNLAEQLLAEGGYPDAMGHSLGHSVGIDIHESPNLSRLEKVTLKAGNVVTVEPGIYISGKFGMRLEDFGIVTADGYQVFTKSSHDMVIIGR